MRSRGFWNLIAHRYAGAKISDETSYQHKLAVTQSYFRPDMEVLEFACGTGTTALIHAPFVARYHGIDYAPKMIDIAREKAAAANTANLTFEVAAIEDLPEDQTFDAVLGMSILHLLADRRAVLAKVRRLLKPGGLFISSTVCLADAKPLVKTLLSAAGTVRLVPRVRALTDDEVVADIAAAGFAIEHRWRPGSGWDDALFVVARAPA